MKGAQGLLIAGILGMFGLGLNWWYLNEKTKGSETVAFVGVKDGVVIQRGEIIKEKDLVPVRIPLHNAKNLRKFVCLYKDRQQMLVRATRRLEGGDLVFFIDYRTPARELKLDPKKKEQMIWVPVDPRRCKTEFIDPGDDISFLVPSRQTPRLASPDGTPAAPAPPRHSVEIIGPFRVGSIGNRISKLNVALAAGKKPSHGQVIGIIVVKEDKQFDAQTMQLLDAINRSNNRGFGISLHPKKGRRTTSTKRSR